MANLSELYKVLDAIYPMPTSKTQDRMMEWLNHFIDILTDEEYDMLQKDIQQ